ncbi:chloride channel protein A-like [Clavelina lepadiformis]|uniref:chloride channel protein A-like n=1 Tax=Clavelina lepadiformis TaxID=159417 RepID=UPI0040424AE6
MGRIVGQLMVLVCGVHSPAEEPILAWVDPGAMAVIGAAAFFGGVSRLTVSLTVIMLEITNDTSFLLPLMTAVITSKWVGDCFYKHSLYEDILEETSTSSETEPRIVDGTVDKESQNGQDCLMDSPCDSREEARVNTRSVDEKTSLLDSHA